MIDFTNHTIAITNALRSLLVTEFQGRIRMSDVFEPGQLTQGEYYRYFLIEQPVIEFHSKGETRDYTFEGGWYFDRTDRNFKNIFDDNVSKRTERFKRLLHNNRNYIPSSVYKWHHLVVEVEEPVYLNKLDEELEAYSNILFIPTLVIITRSDFN